VRTLLGIALACAGLIFGVWAAVRSVEWAVRAARPGRHARAHAELDSPCGLCGSMQLCEHDPAPLPPERSWQEMTDVHERFADTDIRTRYDMPASLAARYALPQTLAPLPDYRPHDKPHIVPDVAQNLCHCGKPAGHLAKDLAGDHPEAAFDTSTTTFEAVR
jgi:hypothetical protein